MKALLLIPIILSGCAYADAEKAVMLGGKGAARGRDYALIYNGEKSFRDFTTLAGTVAAGYFATAAHKATEATSQVAAKEATKKHAASQATIQNGQNVHGAAYSTAVGAEVPGVVAPAPPVAPVVSP